MPPHDPQSDMVTVVTRVARRGAHSHPREVPHARRDPANAGETHPTPHGPWFRGGLALLSSRLTASFPPLRGFALPFNDVHLLCTTRSDTSIVPPAGPCASDAQIKSAQTRWPRAVSFTVDKQPSPTGISSPEGIPWPPEDWRLPNTPSSLCDLSPVHVGCVRRSPRQTSLSHVRG